MVSGDADHPTETFREDIEYEHAPVFFEKGEKDHAELFQGLKIMDAGEEYLTHMGK